VPAEATTAPPHLECVELEHRYPPHENEPEFRNLPELSLALETQSGEVVLIVDCSHSGVGEITKKAKRATNADVALVTGGFHLRPYSAQYVSNLARTMRQGLGVRRVAPTHCTGDDAIEVFRGVYGEDLVDTGLGSRIELPR